METEPLGVGARLWLAFILPWKILFDGLFAARVDQLSRGELPELAPPARAPTPPPAPVREPTPPPQPVAPPPPAAPDHTAAMQVLSILQREGRFIDFLQEDVSAYADADIGAAARVVHEGCKRGLAEYVVLKPVRTEAEGDAVVLERGFDPTRTRITGNLVGDPPFRGRLAHAGWQVVEMKLPSVAEGHDPHIVAPAEVEL